MNKLKLIIATLTLFSMAACGTTKDSSNLNPKEFSRLSQEQSEYPVIDVRSPEEFKMNHIKGAQNINVNGQDFKEKIALLDKNTPLLVYCKSGSRSANAAKQMREIGLTVYELEGGILKWQEDGLPIEADKKKANSGYTLAAFNDVVSSNDLVLVDFYATWCGPCKMMAPHIEDVKEKYKDQLTVLKVDTDKSAEVSRHFKISAIPMVKLYKDGKEVYSETRYHSLEELETLLKKNI